MHENQGNVLKYVWIAQWKRVEALKYEKSMGKLIGS